MSDHGEMVAELMAITGTDHAKALVLLEATDFNLSSAIDVHFAEVEGRGGVGFWGDEDSAGLPVDEEVRAPDAVKRERLVGDYVPIRRPGAQQQQQQQVIDAFRDFQAEQDAATGSAGSNQGLAKMFEPPKELLFQAVGGGGMEEARAAAVQASKWLLVNVQCNTEFGSYQLNRDTWSNPAVQEIISGTFIFWQVQKASEAGQRVAAAYRLHEFPAVLVVDPVTGAKVRDWTGFMEPERMVEDLVPFMDHSFTDAAAASLATSHLKRKQSGKAEARPLTEEEELEAALAASMQQTAAAAGGQGAGASEEAGSSGRALGAAATDVEQRQGEAGAVSQGNLGADKAAPTLSPEELQAQAAAQLEPEPEASDADGCRVGFRLPDGSRAQRRFRKSAPVSQLYAFCRAQNAETASGRAFFLAEAMPGAPELANLDATIAEANAANSMVVLKWR